MRPAIDGLEVVRLTTQLAGGGATSCITASCPSDKSIVGGGGQWDEGVHLTASRPRLAANGWEVCGASEMPATLEVEARCATLRDDVSVQSVEGTLAFEEAMGGCHRVACPAGSVPIAGGGLWSDTFGHDANRHDPGGWLVCGLAQTAQTLTVEALCATGLQADARFVEGTTGVGAICVYAQCNAGEVMTSGGGVWSGNAGITGYLGVQGEWALCGDPPMDANWTSYAVCARQ